jgi:hypothetical protein
MLVPAGDVGAWAEALTRVAMSPADTVDRWRDALMPPRTMDDVAADYLTLYEPERAARGPAASAPVERATAR